MVWEIGILPNSLRGDSAGCISQCRLLAVGPLRPRQVAGIGSCNTDVTFESTEYLCSSFEPLPQAQLARVSEEAFLVQFSKKAW